MIKSWSLADYIKREQVAAEKARLARQRRINRLIREILEIPEPVKRKKEPEWVPDYSRC